jgi:hypothetical protein
MPIANLLNEKVEIGGLGGIVIVKDLGDIPGGRTLDVSGVASDITALKAGHILVQKTADGSFAPLGVSGEAYVTLPSGYAYAGVLKADVLVKDPRAAILTIGQVNAAASPYPVTEAIKEGLPHIQFLY